MMANEALRAALQAPQEASPATYRDLVESLITEAEVDEAQERAWQRQRRSELRIAELEAREDARAGSTQLGEGAASPTGDAGFRGQDASSSDNASPPPVETESNSQAARDGIQALKEEMARSIARKTSKKLQDQKAHPAKHIKEPGSQSGDRILDFSQRGVTTETSEWDSKSESGSQGMMSAESSRLEMFQSATSASETELAGPQKQYSLQIGTSRTKVSRARPPQESDKEGDIVEQLTVKNGGPNNSTALDGPLQAAVAGIDHLDPSTNEVENGDRWTTEIDASRPQTPTSWEEVAREKSEQLEEAKLLLGAVMEGERAALETVARLELELQENRATVSRPVQKGQRMPRSPRLVLSEDREQEDGQHGDRRQASKGEQRRANGVKKGSEELRTAEKSLQSSRTSSSSSLGDEHEGKIRRLVAASVGSERAPASSLNSAKPSSSKQPNGLHGTQAVLEGMDQESEENAKTTLQELEAREAVYRNHCEVLQQQVRKALEQVELLRTQQREKEARDLALYEGRLSAYVKQMVAVRRDNEALMVQQRALQAEKQHLQEQLDAEHQKRRDECHAAQAQVHSLSDSLSEASEEIFRWTSELHKALNQFEDTNKAADSEWLPSFRSKERGSVEEAMHGLRAEIREQAQALERAADIKKQLADEKAYTARLRGERDKMEKLKHQFEAEVEKLRVEKGKAEEREELFKAQVAELEGVKQEHEKQVSSLKQQLAERERSLAQYKAEIHKELAGLSQHMHEAATQRAREDLEFREAIQKSESLLHDKEKRIRELETEVKEVREVLGKEKEASEQFRKAYEDREREWGQKLQAERDRLRDSDIEVQRLQGLAASQENIVADFRKEVIGKREQLERDYEGQRQAMLQQLERQEEELEWLKEQLEARAKQQWDEDRKEQLVAEVQGILEEYSVGQQLGLRNSSAEETSAEEESSRSRGERKSVERRREEETSERTELDEETKGLRSETAGASESSGEEDLQERVAYAWAEREGRLPGYEKQEESLRLEYDEEIASLKEKVRLLEEKGAQGNDTLGFRQASESVSMQEGVRHSTAFEATDAQRNGSQAATMLGEQIAERVKHSNYVEARNSVRSSPEGRQSLDSGQSGAWSDKRPNEEEPRYNEEQMARDQLLAEKAVLMEENGALKSKVTELQQINQELQLRVKLLEEDRLKLLDKIASSRSPPSAQEADDRLALELAAVQAQLAEASAEAAEQKSRYKHLKGKYLRQLARQQAMQEYIVQGGDSPANLSPRSGVAPSVGRPGMANDTIDPFRKSPLRNEAKNSLDFGTSNAIGASLKSRSRSDSDSRLGTWQESSGDLGPEQRQALVAQKTRVSNGQIQRSRQSSEVQEDNGSSGLDERDSSRRSGQRQINGRGISIQEHPADVPERGPSSGNGQPAAANRFQSQASYRTSTVSSRSVSVGKSRSSHTTPANSVPPSRRQSSTDSVLVQSGIPVGLRVLMDGRPLPGFPAKVEDLGGYFAEARAQSDGSRGARLPVNRVSVPYLRKREDRRVSRASSAPPMRFSYNQSAKVWV